ncbi:MAG: DUF92 domain-containing protein [Thermoplasmata archaeon]|nr:DUF92 domain-containing protein [Thermoplasmata archaeon]
MVLSVVESVIGVAVTVALAATAVWAEAFTASAGVAAAVFASVIVVLAGFPVFAILVLFVVGSVLATRYGFEQKRRANVQEGTRGERGVSNVLAHILLPTALVVGSAALPGWFTVADLAVVFTAALAFGAADTFASEFGVLSGPARSILTWRPVPAGTNGGVSAVGEVWAATGAFTTAGLAVLFFVAFSTPVGNVALLLGGAAAAGFVGCQIDSVLGESLENRGELTKHGTNFLSMLSSVGLAAVIVVVATRGV